jgi:hypothetical protein
MQQLAAIVARLPDHSTGSQVRFVKSPVITKPTTDTECAMLREWAQNTPVEYYAATTDQLAKHLSFMAAALPSKGLDEMSGKMKVAVYASLLGGHTNEALAFMARRACQTLDWFPTPRQCLDLLAEYRPPTSDQERALALCQDYSTDKFNRWMTNLSEGQPIGDVPEQWMRIAVEQGAMRRLADGRYVSRAQYYGPSIRIAGHAA